MDDHEEDTRDHDLREAGVFWLQLCGGVLMLALAAWIVLKIVLMLKGDA